MGSELGKVTTFIVSLPAAWLTPSNRGTFSSRRSISSPYWFSMPGPILGVGSVDPSGHYTAPSFETTAVVRVTDALGVEADAVVTVRSGPLLLMPSTAVVSAGGILLFTAVGGVPPYVFTVANGPGSIDFRGLFIAPSFESTAVVRVRDSQNAVAEAQVTIISPVDGGFDGGADGGAVSSDAGVFTVGVTTSVNAPQKVVTGDWNGDGKTDVAVLSWASVART